MTPLFQMNDTDWVREARTFLEARLPHGELWKDAVDVCISIINMMKSSVDAGGGRPCGQGVFMTQVDMYRILPYNRFWRVFSGEISARYSNGLARAKEGADMDAAGFKPTGTQDDATYMEHKFAWLDAIVFVAETLDLKNAPSLRSDLRKLLYGL